MPRNMNRPLTNPDVRHRSDVPAPPIEAIEQRLIAVLTPGTCAPVRMADQKPTRRERILTVPVMTAMVVRLVWRHIPSRAEVLRVLAHEGLGWVDARQVSQHALSTRVEPLPASLCAQLCDEVLSRIRTSRGPHARLVAGQEAWAKGLDSCSARGMADGSTLEALTKTREGLKEQTRVLGGTMMRVEAFTHVPVAALYTQESAATDTTCVDQWLQRLPVGGLRIVDLGVFSVVWCDALTAAKQCFVTRLREKTASRVVAVLSQGARDTDAMLVMGMYRSHPCKHRVRKVSVLWNQRGYGSLTNVLDPAILSAQQVCELYRRRWRIEEAFLVTKRRLGLASLWVGGTHGVESQLYATWMFSAVLNDSCQHVARALWHPLERISVEMVVRGCSHCSRARHKGERSDLVAFLAAHADVLGSVKAVRNRHTQAT